MRVRAGSLLTSTTKSVLRALNVQFSIDFTVPNAFNEWPDYCINGDRLSFSEITNSPGGSADVLNNIMVAYSWDMSGIPPDARPVGKQFPTNGRMDEFYKSFAEYTVSGYVDNSGGLFAFVQQFLISRFGAQLVLARYSNAKSAWSPGAAV